MDYNLLISNLKSLTKDVILLFAIVDVLGNIPIFVDLTLDMNHAERRKTFNTASVIGFIILVLFALAGEKILYYAFHIKIQDFMVAGGILLLVIAVKGIVVDKQVPSKEVSSTRAYELGAVPIACPLLAGPGAMVSSIMILQQHGYLITILSIGIVFILVWVILLFIEPIYKLLGIVGSRVAGKVINIFIAAIAINFIFRGIMSYIGGK